MFSLSLSRLKKVTTVFVTTGLAVSALSLAPISEAQAVTTNRTFATFSAYGASSQYHVYANNIDWSRTVGAVFYLDGDYWTPDQSKVYFPNNADLTAMARVANQRNMVFVPVISPDKDASGDGITWWQSMDYNGDWFRAFAQNFIQSAGIDRSNVWTIGYSGGAEITGFELLADRQDSWRSGGGSIMVGGGNSNGMQTWPSSTAKNFSLRWYVGELDGKGVTWPSTWSALGAAQDGYRVYKSAGFNNAQLTILPSTTHYNYNFASILDNALPQRPVSSPYALVGAIGSYYWANGASGKFGEPTTNEFSLRDGGVGQAFAKNYTIYWTPRTGAYPVYFSGGIGARYRTGGYENGYGYPVFAETAISGGAMQKFALADGRRFAFYWTPEHGRTHVVWEAGGIGGRFTREGGTGTYGFPSEDETAYAYGARQTFRLNGKETRFYWSPTTGTRTMNGKGAIFSRWVDLGHATTLGFPLTDEQAIPGGAQQVFRAQNGWETRLIWSPATGTHKVAANGALYWYWVNNGYTSTLGFPTTDETAQADGSVTLKFSSGAELRWTEDGGVERVR